MFRIVTSGKMILILAGPPDKSAYLKTIFFISHPKNIL